MQISELIKLTKSSSLRSGSGSRIIIKFDISNIRNRRAPARSPPPDSLLINKRRLPWQKFRDGPRCLKILRHLSSRAKVKVSRRRSRTWCADLEIWGSGWTGRCGDLGTWGSGDREPEPTNVSEERFAYPFVGPPDPLYMVNGSGAGRPGLRNLGMSEEEWVS
ncbi:uncharacterized protein LOC119549522 [Drosophila subpulchrella]|uniref:uncharacterized protein LOC119549522 n=1 Tax=Drosophila subpulchrella TaxID=1486046 RepID=UPI0018A149F1|nr:uncharacterized protein LOC119549522 [Drosophila subpulchrella]